MSGSGWATEVNTTSPQQVISAGRWYSDFTKYPSSDGLLRQDMAYGCNGGGFDGSCRAIFKNNNFYQYSPDTGKCCLAFPNLAPTPPDWLVNISTSTGTAVYTITGVVSDVWQFLDVHTYFSDIKTGLPVGERGIADPNGVWSTDLLWYSVTTDTFNSNVFDLPNDCKSPCLDNTGKDIMLNRLKTHFGYKL